MGNAVSHQYKIFFEGDDTYAETKRAFKHDLKQMGFDESKIAFDDATRTMGLDYSFFQLYVYFGQEGKEVGKILPFSWYPPSAENLSEQTKQKPFRIERSADLLADYKNRTQQAEDLFSRWPDIAKPASGITDQNATDALHSGRPVVLGEWHMHRSPRQFLIDHMNELAAANMPIVLEHTFKSQQPLIDQWLVAGPDAPMAPELREMVDFFDKSFDRQSRQVGGPGTTDAGFKDLMISAKRHGVKLIAFEDELSMMAPQLGRQYPPKDLANPGFHQRVTLMNLNAYEAAKSLVDAKKPFLAFVGTAHAVDHHDAKNHDYVPGLARMVDGISIAMGDARNLYPLLTPADYESFERDSAKADIVRLEQIPSAHMGIPYRDDWATQPRNQQGSFDPSSVKKKDLSLDSLKTGAIDFLQEAIHEGRQLLASIESLRALDKDVSSPSSSSPNPNKSWSR